MKRLLLLTLGSLAGIAANADNTPLSTEELRQLTPQQLLGQRIFFDANLSNPAGLACASCHDIKTAFTEPDSGLPVSDGASPGLLGSRNAPTAMYASLSPPFRFDERNGNYEGGQFWDGRAVDLQEQAKGPFLGDNEMNNPNEAAVIEKIRRANYAGLFEQVYGVGALNNVDTAYEQMAGAIAAFEATHALNRFTSKFDAFLAGRVQLSADEERGRRLFSENGKARCGRCHNDGGGRNGRRPAFTDFRYHNLGVPGNPAVLAIKGNDFVDLGLGETVNSRAEDGKFKTPTLRNIAKSAPYMHNGVFTTLREVIDFYNTRDTANWPSPEVGRNVTRRDVGDLRLTRSEINDLIAFMHTLTDGYAPETVPVTSLQGDVITFPQVKLDTGALPSPVYRAQLGRTAGGYRLLSAVLLPPNANDDTDAMPAYFNQSGLLEIPALNLEGAANSIVQMKLVPGSEPFEFTLTYSKQMQ